MELGPAKLLVVEFYMRATDDLDRLNGHGLVVLNPPYKLADDSRLVLPFLVRVLEQKDGARFGIDWLSQ